MFVCGKIYVFSFHCLFRFIVNAVKKIKCCSKSAPTAWFHFVECFIFLSAPHPLRVLCVVSKMRVIEVLCVNLQNSYSNYIEHLYISELLKIQIDRNICAYTVCIQSAIGVVSEPSVLFAVFVCVLCTTFVQKCNHNVINHGYSL